MNGFGKFLWCTQIFLVTISVAFATADPSLPSEVVETILRSVHNLSVHEADLTEKKSGAVFVDLNDDNTKEMILIAGGASCGAFHWVFSLDNKMRWRQLGTWCGLDSFDEKTESYVVHFRVRDTVHNGYHDLQTPFYKFLDCKETFREGGCRTPQMVLDWSTGITAFYDGTRYVGRRQ
jgi:hypothetical protein